MDTNKIIDGMGGTSAVADLCNLTTGAVSQWRTSKNGIPKPWLKLFKTMRPDLFEHEILDDSADKEAA